MKTITKINNLRNKIRFLGQEIISLQDNCPHENIVSISRADTGNYSKSDDRYWTENRCHDCDKYWEEEF